MPTFSPGEQVAQKMELSANASEWKPGSRDIQNRLATNLPTDETKKEEVQYLLFLPKDYDATTEKSWPLLLFLHGAGERGDDLEKVTVHGPPKLLKDSAYREKCPFIVVSPQCRENFFWSPKQLLLLLDGIEKEYNVDQSRVYVTGLSMGGFGSWMLAAEAPDRFAAVAPICGGFQVEQASKLVDVPIWAFHGLKDTVVPAKLSIDMVAAVEVAGGKKIKLTLYPEAGHDSWTETYNNEELYKWFLSK
ncbi:MAG: prolyl oligopeptidase family serine peptidase [Planctomycetaceae bacterium]|nr:prolyl oligopeptidase family serine peptidase [Planctomycetaceae bacterium]